MSAQLQKKGRAKKHRQGRLTTPCRLTVFFNVPPPRRAGEERILRQPPGQLPDQGEELRFGELSVKSREMPVLLAKQPAPDAANTEASTSIRISSAEGLTYFFFPTFCLLSFSIYHYFLLIYDINSRREVDLHGLARLHGQRLDQYAVEGVDADLHPGVGGKQQPGGSVLHAQGRDGLAGE